MILWLIQALRAAGLDVGVFRLAESVTFRALIRRSLPCRSVNATSSRRGSAE